MQSNHTPFWLASFYWAWKTATIKGKLKAIVLGALPVVIIALVVASQ